MQEIQSELPRGSIPRSMEVVLRAEAVETAQPGDRCDFTGKEVNTVETACKTLFVAEDLQRYSSNRLLCFVVAVSSSSESSAEE